MASAALAGTVSAGVASAAGAASVGVESEVGGPATLGAAACAMLYIVISSISPLVDTASPPKSVEAMKRGRA